MELQYFYSFLIALVLSLLLVAWRKPLVYVLALWFHQLCDRMWMRPWVALWPLTGRFDYRDMAIDEWVYNVLNPYNVISDLIGFTVLLIFAWHYRLFRWQRLVRWIRSGVLESPSGAST